MLVIQYLTISTVAAALVMVLLGAAELARWLARLPVLWRLERRWHGIPQDRWVSAAAIPLATVVAQIPVSYGINLTSDAGGERGAQGLFWVLVGVGLAGWYLSRYAAGSYNRLTPKVRYRTVVAGAKAMLTESIQPDLRSREAMRIKLLRVNRIGCRLATFNDGGWRAALGRERRWLVVVTSLALLPPVSLVVFCIRQMATGVPAGRLAPSLLIGVGTAACLLLATVSRRYRIRTERNELGRELQQSTRELLGSLVDPTTRTPVPTEVLDEIGAALRRTPGWHFRPVARRPRVDGTAAAGRSELPGQRCGEPWYQT
ncbi:hypothetical protein DER29_2700 [Micromonospora sp. M71_S20]|uniref:hypothetical protein n=1 Tax=Micromonospora sp. M71_S20 TaxID=592872 RepID=UPI000EB4470C|nr:hypothetical protein [Micromonospora sp. M71_S20]RLK24764.1 hypothetical protein DER29_2700 [Micromonospora sp. M71_S20]